MSKRFLLGLDVGGGSGRCLVIDVDSQAITAAYRPWSHPAVPGSGGWGFDLDLNAIWRLLGEATHDALRCAGAAPHEVMGVAVTSMRHGIVALDKNGHPLLAVPNRDARAATAGLELADTRGQEFYQRTGRWPNPVFAASRLKWLAECDPLTFAKIHIVLSVSEWVSYRLCGQWATESSHAGETLLFDLEKRAWAGDLMDSLSFPRHIFPPVSHAGAPLGRLTNEAAAHLGLQAGTPVAVGGADTQCGLLGAGVIRPGQLGIIAGTTTPLQLVLDRPHLDPQARLWTGGHVIPGRYVLESNAGMMGEGLEWIARILYPDARWPATMLDAEAAQSQPGAAGLLSTFGAQVFDGRNMTLPLGHLTLSHLAGSHDPARRKHLARSILEGLAYAVRANAQQIETVAGISQPETIVTGGMSRSTLWPQLVADVLGRPIRVARVPEATALGAAICAGVGAGLFHTLDEGSTALTGSPKTFAPQTGPSTVYQELYATWSQVRAAHKEADTLATTLLLQAMSDCQPVDTGLRQPPFRPRILVTAQMDEEALTRLRALGEVEYASYRDELRLLSGEDLVEALRGVHVLVTEIDVVDADVLAKSPDLRLLVSCRGNAVNIDLASCTAFGIPVLNTPGRNADAVADLTVAFMLMLARKLPAAMAFLRQPDGEAGDMSRMGQAYAEFKGVELWRKTVGLIGMGAVGRGVARRLLPFGARLLVYDPYLTPEQATLAGAEPVSLETLLASSDFVSLHAAVTPETTGLIGAAQLAMMKPGAFLINTARAALTDEAAIVDALHSGHLGGVAVDVFAVEPPGADDPLLNAPNVIATLHVGGNTAEVASHQGQIVADELERLLRGERPRFVLNPETLPTFTWQGPRATPTAEALAQLRRSPGPAVTDLDARSRPAPPAVTPATVAPATSSPAAVTPPATVEAGKKGFFSGLKDWMGRGKSPAGETLGNKGVKPEGPAVAIAGEGEGGSAMVTRLQQILSLFLSKMAGDTGLQQFAAGKNLVMHYILTDCGLQFYMSFRDGQASGAMGTPPSPADITLKMKADIFDGMMTGRVNGTQAAMTGKLKFSGDTSKAMAMQKIAKDMGRLYLVARSEVGDPGDLTAIAAPASVSAAPAKVSAPAAAAPAPPVTPVRPAGSGDERDEMVAIVQELYDKNLITATGGNISVRVSGRPDQLWITPSQWFKGSLHSGMMVRIDLAGQPLDEEALSPSSEKPMHTAILKARPELNAIIHSHAPWATLLALTETPFLPISTEAAFIGEIPRVPFIMPGSRELAEAVVQALGKDGSVVLLQNHGLLVAASSLRRAANVTEVVERTAEMILRCRMLGKEPPVLPAEILPSLQEIGQMMA